MIALLSASLYRLRLGTLLLQIVGTAVILLVGFFWLEVPDSRTWQLIFTFLLALALLAGALWVYARVIRGLRAAHPSCSMKLAVLTLLGWAILKWILIALVSVINNNVDKRAGYWNSQLSVHMRTIFTYERLGKWQHDLVSILIWVVIPAIILPFIIETTSRGLSSDVWRTGLKTLARWQHWLTIVVAVTLGCTITHGLVKWHPAHGVTTELISVGLRVTIVYIIDMLLIAFVLALDSELLSRNDIHRDAAAA